MAKLIILMGLPGSGKSTYAAYLFAKEHAYSEAGVVIHSSDAIREELFGDPGSQEDNSRVFEIMHRRTKEALRKGMTVIYDATNISRKARKAAINLASEDDKIEGHIVWAPINICIERDKKRSRTVGEAVIDKMVRRWQSPWHDEGFDNLYIHCSNDTFDQVQYISQAAQAMMIPHDNPHHTLGVAEHCRAAYDKMIELVKDLPAEYFIDFVGKGLVTAAYWHDVGKPYTKFYKKNPDTCELDLEHAHYYDHHCVGGYMSYGLFLYDTPLRQAKHQEEACFISWLITNHMEPFFNTKYYQKLDQVLKRCIDLLHEADVQAH
jgi:predicted kinase